MVVDSRGLVVAVQAPPLRPTLVIINSYRGIGLISRLLIV